MLSEYFTAQLAMLPGYEPSTGPVVLSVSMGGTGMFAFLELRDTTLVDYVMTLDSKLELCGRQLKLGRAKGLTSGAGPSPYPMGGYKPPSMYGQQAVFKPLPMSMTDKKARDVYVGNLLQNVVTGEMLSEYFTAQLGILPGYEPSTGPVIMNVAMGGMGKFAFLEMRDTTLVDYMMTLDNKLELCGRSLKLGRAKGVTNIGPSPMTTYQPQVHYQPQPQFQQYQPQQQPMFQQQAYVPQQSYVPPSYAQQQPAPVAYAPQAYAPQSQQQPAPAAYAQYPPQQGY